MRPSIQRHDARGALEVHELAPGILWVKVSGHLSQEVGQAFPVFARDAALRARRCEVQLDVRELEGFDPAVREAWVRVVLEFRARIARVRVVSSKVLITLAARAAGVALERMGVEYELLKR